MLLGNDISNAQGNIDYTIYSKNSNFVIAKATEGNGYIDTWYANNRTQARSNNLPFGSYHFARPDLGNSPEAEAAFFCSVIDGDPIKQGELLALDFEVQYNDAPNWCRQWLDYVSNHYNGMKPLIYLNQSQVTQYDWSPVINAGYGLWIAAYTYDPNNNNVQTGAWDFAAMQQWTDQQQVPGIAGNTDGDVFFGDQVAFGKYGYQPQIQQPSTQPEVVPTPTAGVVPITTTSTSGSTIVNISTQGDMSSISPATNENTVIATQPIPMPTPTKPPFTLGQLIDFALSRIKNTLISLWKKISQKNQ